MLRSAARGAWGKRAAVAGFAVLLLAACGGETGKPGASAETATGPASGSASSAPITRSSDGGAQPAAAPVGALDTSGWLLPPPFYAAGEEPDWRLDIVDGWFVFKRSGLAEIEAPMVQITKEGGADVFDTPPLKVKIKRQACETSNGHADILAEVILDDVVFDGCAFSGKAQSATAASAEASAVIDGLAALDACLADLKQTALVTGVYPREGERTGVALRAKDGILYECAVESDGKTIAYLDPIEPSAAGPWMSRMRFLRNGVSDATKCDGAEEVRDGAKVLGRMLTAKCRL